MRVSARRFFGFVLPVRCVSVEHEVSDVLGKLTSTGRNRVREQNRNAWDESMHALNLAPLPWARQSLPPAFPIEIRFPQAYLRSLTEEFDGSSRRSRT